MLITEGLFFCSMSRPIKDRQLSMVAGEGQSPQSIVGSFHFFFSVSSQYYYFYQIYIQLLKNHMYDLSGQTLITNLVQTTMSSADFTIKNQTSHKVQVIINPGSINKPVDQSLQDCVVLERLVIQLQPKEQKQCKIKTACYNLGKNAPQNAVYVVTTIRDPQITEKFDQEKVWYHVQKKLKMAQKSQQTFWNHVQKKLKMAQKSQQKIKDVVQMMKKSSEDMIKLIMDKKLELHNVEIENGCIVLKIDDPRTKGFYFRTPDDNVFLKKDATQLKYLMGQGYIPGNVIPGGDGKLKVQYPIEFDENQYFHKIDVISKKDHLKALVNGW